MSAVPAGALAALLDTLDEGVLVFDEAERCTGAGRRAAELLSIEQGTLAGRTRGEILTLVAASAEEPALVHALSSGGERTVIDPLVVLEPRPRTLVWTTFAVTDEAGHARGRVDLLRDVTRERRAEASLGELSERLERVSSVDGLTGLVNRRRFEEECLREHRRAQREWISYAVARVDVDGMALINETHGRARGDDILRCLAEELRSSRREYDMVARWAGDEIAILLPRADGRAARKVLRRALDGANARMATIVEGVTASVGAAVWTPPSAEGPADILRQASEALADARNKGPGSIVIRALAGFRDEPTEG